LIWALLAWAVLGIQLAEPEFSGAEPDVARQGLSSAPLTVDR
jgi:hypothetical protein